MKRYYELCITHIDWDTMEDGVRVEVNLPTSINSYEVVVKSEDELGEALANKLTNEYGWCINDIDFVINTISFKLTKKHKIRYIEKTYEDKDLKNIFLGLINYKWRFIYYLNTTPGEYEVELTINGISQDMIGRDYAEDILRETI